MSDDDELTEGEYAWAGLISMVVAAFAGGVIVGVAEWLDITPAQSVGVIIGTIIGSIVGVIVLWNVLFGVGVAVIKILDSIDTWLARVGDEQ